MMGAALAVQSAIVAKLAQSTRLAGVYYDAPARAGFPYVVLTCGGDKEWGCMQRPGREITVQVAVWDDQAARLLEAEADGELDTRALNCGPDWHLSSLVLTGKERLRNPAGAWNCTFRYRARLLAMRGGVQ